MPGRGTRLGAATLLLTATVAPDPRAPELAVRDADLRLQQYLDALGFYLSLPERVVSAIVFAENSGADLEPVRALGDDPRLEVLRVDAADPRSGRSVGEAHIVQEALARSARLAAADGDAPIWKLTGRYVVHNISRLIVTAPVAPLYINLRRRPVRWCDTYAYAFTREGHARYLAGAGGRFAERPDDHGEAVLATLVEELLDAGEPVVPRFRHEPRVSGVRGWDQVDYGSLRQRSKYVARVVARRTLPKLWV